MSYTINRLRQLREEKDVKQITAAEELGISRAMLSNYESGQMPSLWNAIKLADYYHVSLDYIFGRSAERGSTEGEYVKSFTTLAGLTANSAPTASDIQALVDASIMYLCSGAPCGEQPLVAWRDFMRYLKKCLDASVAGDSAALIDSANAATVAALQVTKMPAAFLNKNKGE